MADIAIKCDIITTEEWVTLLLCTNSGHSLFSSWYATHIKAWVLHNNERDLLSWDRAFRRCQVWWLEDYEWEACGELVKQ